VRWREILRRIFVTVHERQWREGPATHFEYAIDEAAGLAAFNARHVGADVDFKWRGAGAARFIGAHY
jgi:hypothetical protein